MMTDSAVKTPKKRKSGEGLPPSGKKQKLNGVQQKPKTPQATPNKDGQKKLGKFAGTAALKNFNQQKQKSPKNKNADGAEANNKEKIAKKNRKRNSAFKSLTGIINEGNDSAKKDAIAKIEDKIKAIENRDEKSKSAQRKLKFLKRLKNRAEGKAPAPVQQNAEKTNKTKARRDRKNKLKKLGEGEQNIQEKQGQKKGAKAAKQQVVQKTEEESSEESDEQEAVASLPKAQKGKAKQKPQQKKNVPQAQDESDDGEEDESDAEGEEESGEEEESGSDVEGEEDENDDEEEGDAEEGSDDEESEEEPAPKPIQKNQIVKTESKTKNKGDVVQNVKLEDLEKNNLVSKGQKRYILFIGNIPYDTTKQDLVEHFKKAGDIVHVRIPTEKGSKKPRGFAYLEVKDNIVYEKCLSMHHSFLKGRRLNVLYTQSGKKKSDGRKSEVKKKNMKLQALRKQGKLVGSVKESQKRSFRRNKKKNASTVQREQDE